MHLNGMLQKGYNYDELLIGDDVLSAEAEEFNQKVVQLKYYISNQPINPESVVEDMLRTFYEGMIEADGTYVYGTSWTGCYARHDTLEIGGHDIIGELSQHQGKYCYLIIELLS